jgi:hypothetical protein
MVGEAMSMTAGKVMLMMVGDPASMSMVGHAESTVIAGDEPSTLVDADELVEAMMQADRWWLVKEPANP